MKPECILGQRSEIGSEGTKKEGTWGEFSRNYIVNCIFSAASIGLHWPPSGCNYNVNCTFSAASIGLQWPPFHLESV